MAYLYRVAERARLACGKSCTPLHPRRSLAHERTCGSGIMGKQFQKRRHAFPVVFEVGRKLPKNRPELTAQIEEARGQEIRERLFDLPQATLVRDVAGSLDREHEVIRSIRVPLRVALRSLQGIERAIDLDRVQH